MHPRRAYRGKSAARGYDCFLVRCRLWRRSIVLSQLPLPSSLFSTPVHALLRRAARCGQGARQWI